MSTTYQPKRKKRKRAHGFLSRQKKGNGKRILKRRRAKKREKLSS